MIERLKRMVISADVDEDSYQRVYPELRESNRSSLVVFTTLALFFLIAMMIMSYFSSDLEANRLLYSISGVIVGVEALLSMRPAKAHPKIIQPLVYIFSFVLLGFGIILGTVTVPDEVTAAYIALMLTVPQVFTDRPYRQYGMIFISVGVFIIMVVTHKDPSIWNSDIVNAVVFGFVSAFSCTYTNKIKAERFCMEDTIRFMAENDQLTGMKNRNSYELKLQNDSFPDAGSLFCVFVDVNGLHELNNTQGHAAGDRMLQYVATSMQAFFGKDDTYRIGGDEYVVLGQNLPMDELRNKVDLFRQAVSRGGYHVAVGIEYQSRTEMDLDLLVRAAEKGMYQDKKDYYRQSGSDRGDRLEENEDE